MFAKQDTDAIGLTEVRCMRTLRSEELLMYSIHNDSKPKVKENYKILE